MASHVTCMGSIRAGGGYTRSGGTIRMIPDTDPSKVYVLIGNIGGIPSGAGRIGVAGDLLSDDRIVVGGWGLRGPNEAWLPRDDVFVPGGCNAVTLGTYPAAPIAPAGNGGGGGGSAVEIVPAPFDAMKAASISYNGATRVVTIIVGGGRQYTLDVAGTDPSIVDELRTTAPQGSLLQVSGTWTPAAGNSGSVAVQEWYIDQLGPGAKKYGIGDNQQLVPQSPNVPSTDWPGGIPPKAKVDLGGPSGTAGATRNNLILIGAVLAILKLMRVI